MERRHLLLEPRLLRLVPSDLRLPRPRQWVGSVPPPSVVRTSRVEALDPQLDSVPNLVSKIHSKSKWNVLSK